MKKKDFKPHNMYNPKTGKATVAKTYEQHLSLKKKGYGHSPPKKQTSKKEKESFSAAVERRVNGGY
ncbi:MAG: hypothetical protein CL681_17070 [Blastopirellula sp.]|nr:hypothetical protein [Blastopirellula sp.]